MQREDYQRYNRYKWMLWLVIASFVIWGAGSFREKDIGLMAARVGDREISREEFVDAYRRQYELYQQFAAGNPELMKDLPTQTLDALVDQKLLLLIAEEHGFSASPEEIADQIREFPIFQENGVFVGAARYRSILRDRLRRPAAEFERSIAEDLTARKFQRLVQDSVLVSEPDLRAEYEASLTVQFDYVKVDASRFSAQVAVADAEIQGRYDKDPKHYEAPEKRQVQFAYLRPDEFAEQVPVSDDEARAQYEKDKETRYKKGEERRASHILFKVAGADPKAVADAEAAVRPKAEAVLARARAGEDFATLAREFSEDTSAAEGGDLGFFPRGRMVGPFEEKTFSMQPGEISDLVRSEFGFHIIKLVEAQAEGYRSFDEVKASIVSQLRRPGMDARAKAKAEELAAKAAASGLEAAAKELGLPLKDSGLVAREDPIPGLGKSDEFGAAVFAAEVGKASQVIAIVPSFLRAQVNISVPPSGYALFSLKEIRPPQIPPLAEVRAQIEREIRLEKAKDVAKAEVDALAAELASTNGADAWKAVLTAKGYTAQDSGPLAKGAALPAIPDSQEVVTKVLASAPGALGRHDLPDGGAVLSRTVARQAFDEVGFAGKKTEIRDRLLAQRRSDLLQSILTAARDRYEIEMNQDLLQEFKAS